MPRAARSAGAGRSGRTSSHASGPSSAACPRRARRRGRRRAGSEELRRDRLQERAEPEVDVECACRSRASPRARRARATPAVERGTRRPHEGGLERRRPSRNRAPEPVERDAEPDRRARRRATRGRRARRDRAPTEQEHAGAARGAPTRAASVQVDLTRATPASSACAHRLGGRELVLQLLERLDRLLLHLRPHIVHGEPRPCEERRRAAPRPGTRPPSAARTRSRYSSGASASCARPAGGRERALHPGVGPDHGAPRVALRAEVVERRREHVGERLARRLVGGPRARRRPRSASHQATRPTTARSHDRDDRPDGELGLVAARGRAGRSGDHPDRPRGAGCARRRRSARPRAR